jgi:hypothetical protein
MNEIIPMFSADPVLYGAVKIICSDEYEAVADLRPVINKGEPFSFLPNEPNRFKAVKLSNLGRQSIGSTMRGRSTMRGEVINLGSDSLRRRAERKAEILRQGLRRKRDAL